MIMLYEQKTYSRLMQKDEDHDDIDVENDKFWMLCVNKICKM
jgi:hypothetical protein